MSTTPAQRGTGKQTELHAENTREFQEEEFQEQKCDYKVKESEGELNRERWRRGLCLKERALRKKGGGKVGGTL